MAPWTWMASSAAWTACSVACHLARLVSRVLRRPWFLSQAARQTSSRPDLGARGHLGDHLLDQLVLADLLAERLALVGVPDATRRGTPGRGPTAPAATVNRPWSMALIAIRKPSPSSPIRFSTGHAHVVEVDQPGVAGPDPELAVERAGRQAGHPALEQEGRDALVLLRPVDARRTRGSGRRGRRGEIQIFWPLSTYASPSRRAVVCEVAGVRADARLGQPEGRQLLALRLGHQPALPLLLGPPLEQRQAS